MNRALLDRLQSNKMVAGLVAIFIISTLFSIGLYYLTKEGLPSSTPKDVVTDVPITPAPPPIPTPPKPNLVPLSKKPVVIPPKPIEETHTWAEIRQQLDGIETLQAELMRHVLKHNQGKSLLSQKRLNMQVTQTNYNLNTQSLNKALQQKALIPLKKPHSKTNWKQVQQAFADLFIQQEQVVNAISMTIVDE